MKNIFLAIFSVLTIGINAQTIIIFPEESWMLQNQCAKEIDIQGQTGCICDYKKALLEHPEFKTVVNRFGQLFKSEGFEITPLEDAMGELDMTNVLNSVQDLEQSPTELILNSVNPDIRVDLSWRIEGGLYKKIILDVKAKDPKTASTVSSISFTSPEARTISIESAIEDMIKGDFSNFITEMKASYSDRAQNGQKLSLQINVGSNSEFNMESEVEGEELADVIYDFVKSYAKNGKVGTQSGSETSMKIQNIRVEATSNCVRDLQKSVTKFLKTKGIPAYANGKRQGTVQIVVGEKQ